MIEIRKLKASDLFTVLGMLRKSANSEITNLIVSDTVSDKKPVDIAENPIKLGIMVLTSLYDNLADDLINWFASLCNKTKEEFMDLSIDAPLDVIEQLATGDEYSAFFLRVLRLSKTMQSLGKPTNEK